MINRDTNTYWNINLELGVTAVSIENQRYKQDYVDKNIGILIIEQFVFCCVLVVCLFINAVVLVIDWRGTTETDVCKQHLKKFDCFVRWQVFIFEAVMWKLFCFCCLKYKLVSLCRGIFLYNLKCRMINKYLDRISAGIGMNHIATKECVIYRFGDQVWRSNDVRWKDTQH